MKRKYKILISIGIILIVIRLILPSIILHFANKSLANMEGYYGHIEDIDLAIIRGAYVVNGIYLNKVDSVSKNQTPFFKCAEIDLSVEWASLFKGSIVGELVFESPELLFSREKVEPKDLQEDTSDFRDMLKDFMPLKINRVEVNAGKIQYVDSTSNPIVDVEMTDVHVLCKNLTNVVDEDIELPATIEVQAALYGGSLSMNMKLNALAEHPTFDMNAELKNMNLTLPGKFFKAYGKFDVNSGTFGVYTEMAARDNKFVGYVKPLIENLDVVGEEDRDDNILSKVWESVIGAAAFALQNQKEDRLATKVELEGSFDNPKVHTLEAILQVLRNAFIQALMPSIDNEISLGTVGKGLKNDGPFFKRLFDKDKKK